MDWKTHKKQLLKNPKFRKALAETRLEYEVARAVILARTKHKLTQKELAQKLNTQQSVISRVENGQTIPSLSFLQRLANTLGGNVTVNFRGI